MLNQPMMEKLLAMRLQGMVEALKTQEQDRAINELSLLEGLSLLVDQQWSWRENQALARRLKAAKLRAAACWRTSTIGLRGAWTRRWCVLCQKTRPGSATTKTFSCWVRPASARALSHRLWRRKPVARFLMFPRLAENPHTGVHRRLHDRPSCRLPVHEEPTCSAGK